VVLPGEPMPALIPIVGIRVAGKHTQSLKKKKKLKSTQRRKLYYLVCKYKDKIALE